MKMDLESNVIQQDVCQECTNDQFSLEPFSLPPSVSGILGIGISQNYVIFSTSKHEVYRYIFGNRDSLNQAYSFPQPKEKEKEKEGKSSIKGQGMQRETAVRTQTGQDTTSIFFCDPHGNHTIIRHYGRIYYFNIKSSKIRDLPNIKDISVTAVAWDEKNESPSTTSSILLGDFYNQIYEYRIDVEKDDKIKDKITPLIKLEGSIQGLFFTNKEIQREVTRYVCAVTTHQLYQFTGVVSFKDLFKKYEDVNVLEVACKTFPSSSHVKQSQIQLLHNNDDKPCSFGWKSDAGFCCADINEGVTSMQKFTVTPYEKIKKDGKKEKDENPIAIAHSTYHIFFLFNDCLTIISKITANIIHTEYLKESFIDMRYDRFTNSIWFCTSAHLYQMKLEEEDANVWQDYLEKGQYKSATDFCKEKKQNFSKKISRIAGNSAFEKQDYHNAAIQYAESDEKFEEVGLKFLANDQYDPLMNYLYLISETRIDRTEKTQMCLITTWMVEIYLHQINSLRNSDEIESKSKELTKFMQEKEDFLDKDTIYQLLQQYGRVAEFLKFAENKKDYETVILHYINDKKITDAICKLKDFAANSSDEKMADVSQIFTKYIHIFMKHNAEDTIRLLNDQKTRIKIESNKLISAMMNTDKSKRDQVVKYLKTLIDDSKTKDKNIHNLYIFFLANLSEMKNKAELNDYLKKHLAAEKANKDFSSYNNNKEIPFETEYALKVFSRTQNFQAQALVLAMMGKYSEAVKIALTYKEVDTAKTIAKSIEDGKIKKTLWLDIFKDQIKRSDGGNDQSGVKNNQNFQNSLIIMKESEVLKIEDVLPHIVDNIRIEEFKEQISNCINVYEENIQKLKKEISSYNDTAENIKTDIYKVKKKSIEIQYKHCLCDVCNCNIKDNNIYLFPCGHMFDTKCIMEALGNYSKYLDSAKKKCMRLDELSTMIEDLEKRKEESKMTIDASKGEKTFLTGIMGLLTDKDKKIDKITITNDELNKLEEIKVQFSNILSEECVLCGNMMIDSTQQGFIGDKASWVIV